jgi:hypothetical protein
MTFFNYFFTVIILLSGVTRSNKENVNPQIQSSHHLSSSSKSLISDSSTKNNKFQEGQQSAAVGNNKLQSVLSYLRNLDNNDDQENATHDGGRLLRQQPKRKINSK